MADVEGMGRAHNKTVTRPEGQPQVKKLGTGASLKKGYLVSGGHYGGQQHGTPVAGDTGPLVLWLSCRSYGLPSASVWDEFLRWLLPPSGLLVLAASKRNG